MTSNFKTPRVNSEKHRRFIASLPCCVSGRGEVQCAHIRDDFYCMSRKPGDDRTVPLNHIEHARQHKIGEKAFWEPYGGVERAKELGQALWENSGDEEACLEILNKFRMGIFLY